MQYDRANHILYIACLFSIDKICDYMTAVCAYSYLSFEFWWFIQDFGFTWVDCPDSTSDWVVNKIEGQNEVTLSSSFQAFVFKLIQAFLTRSNLENKSQNTKHNIKIIV